MVLRSHPASTCAVRRGAVGRVIERDPDIDDDARRDRRRSRAPDATPDTRPDRTLTQRANRDSGPAQRRDPHRTRRDRHVANSVATRAPRARPDARRLRRSSSRRCTPRCLLTGDDQPAARARPAGRHAASSCTPRSAEGEGHVPRSSSTEAVAIIRQPRQQRSASRRPRCTTQGDNIVISSPGRQSTRTLDAVGIDRRAGFRPVLQVAAGARRADPDGDARQQAADPPPPRAPRRHPSTGRDAGGNAVDATSGRAVPPALLRPNRRRRQRIATAAAEPTAPATTGPTDCRRRRP